MSSLISLRLNEKINPERLRRIGIAIMIAALLNLLAALFMAFILGPGTLAGDDINARASYIVQNRMWMQIGWASWIVATLSLILVFQLMYETLDSRYRTYLLYALILSVVGGTTDILADLISLGIIPDLAERYLHATSPLTKSILHEQFISWDRFSVYCTGGVGNTAYGIAGCILSYVIFRTGEMNFLIRYLSIPLWLFTFSMSYGSFALSSWLLPFAVGITMATFIVWCFLIGFVFFRAGTLAGGSQNNFIGNTGHSS